MQICALDSNATLVFAPQATKQKDYSCLECQRTVRVRAGMHRQPHFFHIRPNIACRQHGKSMVHLLLQYYIKEGLPEGEAHLEYRFDAINRIADVVWTTRRLVYEIQYSHITAEEIAARNQDYASIGYQVVWILHDHRYNKKMVTAAEDVLQASPFYFSNMKPNGEGYIYDEFAFIHQGNRILRLPRHQINFGIPRNKPDKTSSNVLQLPHPLKERALTWTMGFAQDTLDRCLELENNDEALWKGIETLAQLSKKPDFLSQSIVDLLINAFSKYLKMPYQAILRLFLERSCR